MARRRAGSTSASTTLGAGTGLLPPSSPGDGVPSLALSRLPSLAGASAARAPLSAGVSQSAAAPSALLRAQAEPVLAHLSSSVARPHPEPNPPSFFSAITTYLGYAVLIMFGHLRDMGGKLTGYSRYYNSNSVPVKVRATGGGGGRGAERGGRARARVRCVGEGAAKRGLSVSTRA